ncbi:MAG: transposase, partial [Prevotellaceae bacterium]|nr:transposase [Prevotellaceae bacterium]
WFRTGRARYKGLEKTHTQHLLEAIAYNLYRAPGIIIANAIK